MASYYDQITPEQAALIAEAPLFFVASADPALESGAHGIGPINLSPKGGVRLHIITIGERYHLHRQQIMLNRQEGLTKTYNRFHSADEASEDIAELRRLHVAMDQAVAAAYGWGDLDLGHGFHQTKQGLRYTISEAARRTVLDRLLALNHQSGMRRKWRRGCMIRRAHAKPQSRQCAARGRPRGRGSCFEAALFIAVRVCQLSMFGVSL